MAVNTIAFRCQDDESDTKFDAQPIYVPTGLTLAQYQSFATAAAPVLDAVTESKLAAIDLTVSLTIPGGLKASPVASALNERGGNLGMKTVGQWPTSLRIPAIDHTIMSGDEFSIADTAIAAVIALLVAGDAVVFPRDRYGFTFDSGLYGKKSLQRK